MNFENSLMFALQLLGSSSVLCAHVVPQQGEIGKKAITYEMSEFFFKLLALKTIVSECRWKESEVDSLMIVGKLGKRMKNTVRLSQALVKLTLGRTIPNIIRSVKVEFVYDSALDGPTAGLCTAVAIWGAIKGTQMPTGLVIIGKINLFGNVEAVEDLVEMVQECIEKGHTAVMVPGVQFHLIPDPMKGQISVHPVATFVQAIELIQHM